MGCGGVHGGMRLCLSFRANISALKLTHIHRVDPS